MKAPLLQEIIYSFGREYSTREMVLEESCAFDSLASHLEDGGGCNLLSLSSPRSLLLLLVTMNIIIFTYIHVPR